MLTSSVKWRLRKAGMVNSDRQVRLADEEISSATTPGVRVGAVAGALVLAAIVLLYPYRFSPPVSDDFLFARSTPPIDVAGALFGGWEHPIGRASAYRPVTVASYRLNQLECGSRGDIRCYHVTNYAVHGVVCALLLVVAMRCGLPLLPAFVAGALFLVYPPTHENVFWISGRTFPLGALFGLAACALAARRRLDGLSPFGVYVFALLALSSYEGVILLPAIAVVCRAVARGRVDLSRAALAVVAAYVTYLAVRWSLVSTPANDVWMHSNAISRELGFPTVWPRFARNLSHFWQALLGITGPATFAAEAAAAVCALMGAAVVGAHRHSAVRAAVAVGLALLGGGFAPFATGLGIADRFLYLSGVGLCLAAAAGFHVTWRLGRMGRALGVTAVVATLIVWAANYRSAAAEWREAGEIAERVLSTLQRAVVASPVTSKVAVFSLPLAHKRAHVFITYFDLALSRRIPPGVTVESHVDGPGASIDVSDPRTLVFRWDASRADVVKLTGDLPER